MLQKIHTLHSGEVNKFCHEHTYINESKAQDGSRESLELSVIEISTNLIRSSFKIENCFKLKYQNLLLSSHVAMCYDPTHNSYLSYNILTNQLIATIQRPFKHQNRLLASNFSTLSDNVFMYIYSDIVTNEVFLDILTVKDNKLNLLTVAHFEKLSASPAFGPGPRGKVTAVHFHPTLQMIFVVYASGPIQVGFNPFCCALVCLRILSGIYFLMTVILSFCHFKFPSF